MLELFIGVTEHLNDDEMVLFHVAFTGLMQRKLDVYKKTYSVEKEQVSTFNIRLKSTNSRQILVFRARMLAYYH